jgi:hypothetical protein
VKTKAVNPAAAKPTSSGSLAAIFGGPSAAVAAVEPANKKPRNLLDSLFDPKPAKQIDTVTSDDSLVKTTTTATNKPRSMFSSLFDEPCVKAEATSSETRTGSVVEERAVTEKGDVMTTSKMEITKVYDFAGEIVKLVRVVHQCCGSCMFIPDPGFEFFHPGFQGHMYSGSASMSLSILPQKLVLNSPRYDPGCSSRIRILIFTHFGSRTPDPGVKKAPDP